MVIRAYQIFSEKYTCFPENNGALSKFYLDCALLN